MCAHVCRFMCSLCLALCLFEMFMSAVHARVLCFQTCCRCLHAVSFDNDEDDDNDDDTVML